MAGTRVAFLGPEGTFTHESARLAAAQCGWSDPRFVPYPTSLEAAEAVVRGNADAAVVAVETSLNGPMARESAAVQSDGLRVTGEIRRVCHYALLAPEGASLDGVRAILSNVKALDDCRATLARLAPGVPHERTSSTAAAVRQVAERGDPALAAVGTALAGELYGLTPLAENLEDDPENWTRWLIVEPA